MLVTLCYLKAFKGRGVAGSRKMFSMESIELSSLILNIFKFCASEAVPKNDTTSRDELPFGKLDHFSRNSHYDFRNQ